MRVKSITAKDPAQNILLNYQYNYDKMDNITAKVTEHGEYDYGYDDLYRLTTADNPVQTDEGFIYDAVGNRLTAAGVADNWSYNDNNELQSYDGVTFEYDANGNMTQKIDAGQVTNYIYNVEDRLTEVWNGAVGSGSLISTYYYDPFGRRLWKEVNGVRTYFVYADEELVAEVDAANNVVKSYGYRPNSTWTTDPLFMKVGGQYYFYQNDHLGTPQKLTAVNGAVVWFAKYSSFGEADVAASSSITNNLRFPGQYFDQETDLHYNYHRYYDPKTARYSSLDPFGLLGGLNFYSYSSNNGISHYDSLGLFDETIGADDEEPWHDIDPNSGERRILSCKKSDSCETINNKMISINRTIVSHQKFIYNHPDHPKNKGHAEETLNYYKTYKKCIRLYRKKKCDNCDDDRNFFEKLMDSLKNFNDWLQKNVPQNPPENKFVPILPGPGGIPIPA